MILGLGTDIVELARIDSVVARNGASFLHRVYTANELDASGGRIEFLAGRWAAKEAAAKALGCGIGASCSFTDIEVVNGANGAPQLECRAPAAAKLKDNYPKIRWHVSISHEKAYAVATVMIEAVSQS